MKKIIYFILIGIFSCEHERTRDRVSPADTPEDNAWQVYEGRVPLNEKTNLYLEVSMLPSEHRGEGSFVLHEFLEEEGARTPQSSFKGNYSTLYGETPEAQVIQFHHSAQEEGVKRTYLSPGFQGEFANSQIKMIREEVFRKTDLTVKIQGKNHLLVLDENLKVISTDPAFTLTKRTSKLFTVEGYFRHNGDTADFLEMNTKERWAVTKLGNYDQAISQYHRLASDKFEVTYLKGIGYSVRHINKDGREVEALVLKQILQMTSAPALTEEYNQLSR
jgi:hypothetical protein